MTDATFTEKEMEYLENTNVDSGALFVEIRKLNAKVDTLNDKIEEVSEEERRAKRKAEIMAIKSKSERLRAINDNLDLWR